MFKIISQSETTASSYDAGARSSEGRTGKEIDTNVQIQNPNDEAMFDETTMIDDDEVMGKSKATLEPKPSWWDDDDYTVQNSNDEEEGLQKAIGDPMARLQLQKKRTYCEVCCEEVEDHLNHNCPYWDLVPKGARVGELYDIVCTECGDLVSEHKGELNVDFEGRVVLKYCEFCRDYSTHWTEQCESMPKTMTLTKMNLTITRVDK